METAFSSRFEKIIRYTLGSILLFVGLNAIGGGFYGLAGAKGVPIEWLRDSIFQNYFIPSLVLFVVVGGSAFVGGIAIFRRHQFAKNASFACSLILAIWIGVQLAVIGYVSWLQPAVVLASVLIFILTCLLPK